MPIHDWTRVSDGTWHAFHLSWLGQIQEALNNGRLPPDYYALAEQVTGPMGPDVLALQEVDSNDTESGLPDENGGVAVQLAPPQTRVTSEFEINEYIRKRRSLVIRHSSGDRIIALLELVSPGNKSSRHAIRSFVEKAVEALELGYHLMIVDLFPPTKRDPNGIHNAILDELGEPPVSLPLGEPLTLAAYSAGWPKRAYVEPVAVGAKMIDMPLFLTPEGYINVPLEATYLRAFQGMPRKWKEVLEKGERGA